MEGLKASLNVFVTTGFSWHLPMQKWRGRRGKSSSRFLDAYRSHERLPAKVLCTYVASASAIMASHLLCKRIQLSASAYVYLMCQ